MAFAFLSPKKTQKIPFSECSKNDSATEFPKLFNSCLRCHHATLRGTWTKYANARIRLPFESRKTAAAECRAARQWRRVSKEAIKGAALRFVHLYWYRVCTAREPDLGLGSMTYEETTVPKIVFQYFRICIAFSS